MAVYNMQAGDVDPGHLSRINTTIRLPSGGKQVTRVAWMAQKAIDDFPHNLAPSEKDAGKWARTRGFRMSFNAKHSKWEGHVTSGPYRLDFQGYTDDQKYANWQIQYGSGKGDRGGAAAHVLVTLGWTFSCGQFIEALRRSARHARTCRLEP